MNPRSILTSMSPCGWVVCMVLVPLAVSRPARAEGLPKSCQETTERVLKPFLDRLEAAKKAAQQYEEQNAEKIASINEQIRLRQESRKVFDDAEAKEDETFGNRIQWGNEAMAEARADAQKRIAEKRKLAAEARAKGRDRDAKAQTNAAAKIAADLAAGKIYRWKKELGLRHDINGWKAYVAKQTQDRAKRMQGISPYWDAQLVGHLATGSGQYCQEKRRVGQGPAARVQPAYGGHQLVEDRPGHR